MKRKINIIGTAKINYLNKKIDSLIIFDGKNNRDEFGRLIGVLN